MQLRTTDYLLSYWLPPVDAKRSDNTLRSYKNWQDGIFFHISRIFLLQAEFLS
jgi:hypothetical protein